MKYILKNIDEDDFITEVLSELNCEIRNGDNNDIKVIDTGKSDRKTKGIEISELIVEITDWCAENESLIEDVLGGIIKTGLCGMLKAIIRRLKKTPKYIPEKQIEITQEDSEGNRTTVKMTLQELAEKDER